MEHTNWFLPVQPDRNERPPNLDPRAWLLKVVIEGIELKQKDPISYVMRSFIPGDSIDSFGFLSLRIRFEFYSIVGDGFGFAYEMALVDAWALSEVMNRVHKNDNLREVLTRALRSIRQAMLHAGFSYKNVHWLSFTRVLNGLVPSKPGSKQEYVDASESDSELAKVAYALHAFLSSVLHLLTSVFQYLLGYVDRGGSKTYSSGAFDFRASFVSLVLFQGAYVWIKFRQAARPDCRKRKAPDVQHEVVDSEPCNLKGVYSRPIKDKFTGAIIRFKYEPRFKPPRQEVDPLDGSNHLPLREYHTPAEAQIVLQIARYYYGKDGGCVELEDGRYKFLIPPRSEQEQRLAGKEKWKWVARTAPELGKQMYAEFQREKGKHLAMATEAEAEAVSHGAESNDPSSSALPLPHSPLPMVTTMAAEPAIASATQSSPSLPPLPLDSDIKGGADDVSEMINELLCGSGVPNLPDQPSSVIPYQMQYQGSAQLPEDPRFLEVRAVPEIFFQQSDPVLQQLVFCQKCLGDNARQFVHLDQLKASHIQNSKLHQEYQIQILKLQQEKEQLRTEKEIFKSRLEQVAKSQVATWTGIMNDGQQRD